MVKREKILTKQLRASEKLVGQLHPVLIDADTGETLAGRERLVANSKWRRKEMKIQGETEEEKEKKRIQIKHHENWARKDIDKKADLTEIAERTGWRGLKPFADFLGVSEMDISRYLPQKYKDEIKSKAAKSKSANNPLAKKVRKTAKKLKETRKAIEKAPIAEEKKDEITSSIETTENILANLSEDLASDDPSIEKRIDTWLNEIEVQYSLWECLEKRPEGFGDAGFQGNCSPTIIAAVLKKYSSLEDKLIFDPLAGSGTFIDVAKLMGYRDDQILARDIRSIREDIVDGDAIDTKLLDNSVDFIFAHFPYWKMIEYTEDDPRDASRFSYDNFLLWCEEVIIEMKRILRRKRVLVVMIGNRRKKGVLDLEAELSIIGSKHLTLWDKVIKRIRTWSPETRGQRMGLAIARARQHGYTVTNHDTLLIFRKG